MSEVRRENLVRNFRKKWKYDGTNEFPMLHVAFSSIFSRNFSSSISRSYKLLHRLNFLVLVAKIGSLKAEFSLEAIICSKHRNFKFLEQKEVSETGFSRSQRGNLI